MAIVEPGYVAAYRNGRLGKRTAAARQVLSECTLCPRTCRVDRMAGETGRCGTGRLAVVSAFQAHFGEEAPLVGRRGSGTIFFTRCNLLCTFCQNYDISHLGHGTKVSAPQLADMMLTLQNAGCHNINLVTPTHVVYQILAALEIAVAQGLRIPLVYNTGGYDRVDTLKLLDGIIDIYMPDFKFWNAKIAEQTCHAADYPEIACEALREMQRQVGDLVVDENGIARRGLLVRHLVLPQQLAGTREIMRFIAQQISPNAYVNLMSQYRPCGRASETEGLSAALTRRDYERAVAAAREEGITRLDIPRRVFALY